MSVVRYLLIVAVLCAYGSHLPAYEVAGPRVLTNGQLLIGEWQNESSGMTLHCLANRQAILETNVTRDRRSTETHRGTYAAVRPGIWTLTVKGPDEKVSIYTLTFDQAHHLLVTRGSGRALVFLRAGYRFDELDRDGDGWISKHEARGSPLESRFDEFMGGKDRQVSREGYERFLEKYPHLGSAK